MYTLTRSHGWLTHFRWETEIFVDSFVVYHTVCKRVLTGCDGLDRCSISMWWCRVERVRRRCAVQPTWPAAACSAGFGLAVNVPAWTDNSPLIPSPLLSSTSFCSVCTSAWSPSWPQKLASHVQYYSHPSIICYSSFFLKKNLQTS
jgi:hypothetical protein